MNRKQLAEMIKHLRKKKLDEIIGKPGKFDPEHSDTHPSDKGSPNQYLHRMKTEARVPITSGGVQGKRSLGGQGLKNRFSGQKSRGNQNMKGRSLNSIGEDSVKLGSTDTDKSGETVDVNPNIPTAKGETTKNTTVKETKEK